MQPHVLPLAKTLVFVVIFLCCAVGCHDSAAVSKSSITPQQLAELMSKSDPTTFWVSDGEYVYEAATANEFAYARGLRQRLAAAIRPAILGDSQRAENTGQVSYEYAILVQFGMSPISLVVSDAERGHFSINGIAYTVEPSELSRTLASETLQANLTAEKGKVMLK